MSIAIYEPKLKLTDLRSVVEICAMDMSDVTAFGKAKGSGKIVVFSSANGCPFQLSSKRGQLYKIRELALRGEAVFSIRRFGWGAVMGERDWVMRNGQDLLDSGIGLCGDWRKILNPSARCVVVGSSVEPHDKWLFFELLAASLMTLGCSPDGTCLVAGEKVPLHWLREFCSEMGFALRLLRGEKTESGWLRNDYLYWLKSDLLLFDGRRFSRSDAQRIDNKIELLRGKSVECEKI